MNASSQFDTWIIQAQKATSAWTDWLSYQCKGLMGAYLHVTPLRPLPDRSSVSPPKLMAHIPNSLLVLSYKPPFQACEAILSLPGELTLQIIIRLLSIPAIPRVVAQMSPHGNLPSPLLTITSTLHCILQSTHPNEIYSVFYYFLKSLCITCFTHCQTSAPRTVPDIQYAFNI